MDSDNNAVHVQGSNITSSTSLQHSTGETLGGVQALLAKPMQAAPSQNAAAQTDSNMLYETVWQVCDSDMACEAEQQLAVPQQMLLHSRDGWLEAALYATAMLQHAAQERQAAVQLHLSSSLSRSLGAADVGHATMLAALVKSARQEHKGLVARALHVDGQTGQGQALMLAKPMQQAYLAEEAVSAGSRLTPRLLQHHLGASQLSGPFQLLPQPRGALQNLTPVPRSPPQLQPGTAWLETRAVGVNFRDVLNVLGMYPGDPGAPGADFAGTVTALGSADGTAASLHVGQAVFGLASGCLGSHVQVQQPCVVPMPAQLTFTEAASIPTVYITAHTAFRHAVEVQPKHRVLVHAAAGGVGLAAVQILRELQAAVVASAGAPTKRGLLRQQGIEHVLDSRSSSIASSIAKLGGVDVVLNSLTSPGMVAGSLAGVGVGGAFLEISKRDIWSPARLAQDRPDVRYTLLAVDFLPPSAVQSALTRAAAAVSQGQFRPLPQVLHSLDNSVNALRQMSQAKHVGKVVVTTSCTIASPSSSHQYGRWVITGGLGSLGSLTANWLSEQGQMRLALVGRTGRASSGSALYQQLLSQTSAAVTLTAADLASAEDSKAVLQGHGHTLSGLVHAAGVLADATVQNQSASGIRKTLAAKAGGLQSMRTALGIQPCTACVLFSSVAALLGSAGQANYSAANGVLDGMAGQWQGEGRGGVSSIQWGGWAGGGMAGADPTTASRLARMGMPLINPQQGLGALARALRSSAAVLAAVPFSWNAFLRQPAASSNPLYAEFATDSINMPDTHSHTDLAPASTLRATAAVTLSRDTVSSQIATAVATVIGHAVSPDEPLMAAGLDSLSTVELRNTLESQLGLPLPATLVFDYPTITAMADLLYPKLALAAAAATAEDQIEQIHRAEASDSSFTAPVARLKLVPASSPSSNSLFAVTAMVTRSPADASNKLHGMDTVDLIPLERWDIDMVAQGASANLPCRFGAFLAHVAQFDAAAFSISAAEATLMDPQQRLLLETIAEAQASK